MKKIKKRALSETERKHIHERSALSLISDVASPGRRHLKYELDRLKYDLECKVLKERMSSLTDSEMARLLRERHDVPQDIWAAFLQAVGDKGGFFALCDRLRGTEWPQESVQSLPPIGTKGARRMDYVRQAQLAATRGHLATPGMIAICLAIAAIPFVMLWHAAGLSVFLALSVSVAVAAVEIAFLRAVHGSIIRTWTERATERQVTGTLGDISVTVSAG